MRIVFDVRLRRPACVIIQAAMGAGVPDFDILFPSESWLLSPTPDMGTYEVTEEQLEQLSAMVRAGGPWTPPDAEGRRGSP